MVYNNVIFKKAVHIKNSNAVNLSFSFSDKIHNNNYNSINTINFIQEPDICSTTIAPLTFSFPFSH